MDNLTFAGLLAAPPPVDLSIIELTAELTRPDGSLDLDAAAARQKDVETGLRPGAGLRLVHGTPAGGDAMEAQAAAPPRLSGLAGLLLRRPPSLRELVTLVGYADDYAWFAGLVRRLFPEEAEAALSAPDVRSEGGALRQSLRGAALPPLRPDSSSSGRRTRGTQPPWSWMRRGIPFDLMGFGYDGLHELWHGYREGISALVLLARARRRLLRRTGRDTDGLAGIGRRTHPARDPATDSPRGHTPGGPDRGAEGDQVRGSGQGRLLGLRRDRQLFPRPLLRRWVVRRLLRPLGGRDHRRGHGGVAKGQRPHGLGVPAGRLAGGGPPRPLRRDAGLRPAAAPQTRTRTGGKRS